MSILTGGDPKDPFWRFGDKTLWIRWRWADLADAPNADEAPARQSQRRHPYSSGSVLGTPQLLLLGMCLGQVAADMVSEEISERRRAPETPPRRGIAPMQNLAACTSRSSTRTPRTSCGGIGGRSADER
jgi:hypothetical protein